ncbi:MAG: single-stranded DNA-binding protein [Ferruginibacter sp.]|nr:single-stranded DNA-binding protein [Cytophagales bacterium]
MAGVNKVILVGNLGKDPEVRHLEADKKVAKFTLATTEAYRDRNGQRVENTEWHHVEFWGPVTEVIEKYLKKGSQVYVEGKLRTRSYEDKEGVKKYVTEVIGQNLTLIGGKPSEGEGTGGYGETTAKGGRVNESAPSSVVADNDADDLPF